MLAQSLCLPHSPHQETLSVKHPTGTYPRHPSCGAREGRVRATEPQVAQGHTGHEESELPVLQVIQSISCPFSTPQLHPLQGGVPGHACLSLTPSLLCGYCLSRCAPYQVQRYPRKQCRPGPPTLVPSTAYLLRGIYSSLGSYLLPQLLHMARVMCAVLKAFSMVIAKVTSMPLAASMAHGIKWSPGAAVTPSHRSGIRSVTEFSECPLKRKLHRIETLPSQAGRVWNEKDQQVNMGGHFCVDTERN